MKRAPEVDTEGDWWPGNGRRVLIGGAAPPTTCAAAQLTAETTAAFLLEPYQQVFCAEAHKDLHYLHAGSPAFRGGTMASGSEYAKEGRLSERRNRRSGCLADALRLQLEACREDEGLAAIVVSDEVGFCVAHSGGNGSHDELAARLPMLADPTQRRSLYDDDEGLQPARASLSVTTFSIAGATLHACAVKEPDAARETSAGSAEVLARVASGFTRLLAQ
jgi:hypothetical protein